ncbi:MAG: Serine/threonine protein kinase PrkC, regulator of stationary phase, partial [uncultured Solirubrobacteraceae bacterium]
EHARRHVPQRPLPARRPGRVGWHVDGLPRVRLDARAPGRDQAHAPRDRAGLRPARALPPRGARRRPALAPAHRRRDRRGRGGGPAVHRLRVRRGRDAQEPHPAPRPAADRGVHRLRDRDRPRARRRPRAAHRPPRRQAAERPHRRGGLRQGHGLRDRPLARRGGPDRRRPRPRHDGLRLPRAGARPRRQRAVRHLLARRRALRDARRRGPLQRREPGRGGDEARPRGPARRPVAASRGLRVARGDRRADDRQGPRPALPRRPDAGLRARERARDRGGALRPDHGRGHGRPAHPSGGGAPPPAAAHAVAGSAHRPAVPGRGRRGGRRAARQGGAREHDPRHRRAARPGAAQHPRSVHRRHLGQGLRPARRRRRAPRAAAQRGRPGLRHDLDHRDLQHGRAAEGGRRPLRRRQARRRRRHAADPLGGGGLDRGDLRRPLRPARVARGRGLDAGRGRRGPLAPRALPARDQRDPVPLLPRVDHQAPARGAEGRDPGPDALRAQAGGPV